MECRPAVKTQVASGFTLIELSIVLVIIGLIIGGVLVGQDLIIAATVRAQISQIEKYQSAVNTFRGKYGYLPGDIPDPTASSYGLGARGSIPGEGDGNGIIQGTNFTNVAGGMQNGENLMFWKDLGQANLIDGAFALSSSTAQPCPSGANFNLYFPNAKLGAGNYVFVSNGGNDFSLPWTSDGINYFSIEAPSDICGAGLGHVYFVPYAPPFGNIPVKVAYAIDAKVDDGLPMSGKITAQAQVGGYVFYVNGAGISGLSPYTTPSPPSSTTCYDNGGTNGATQQYSMTQNGGSGTNCSLSFKFQ
jgi:prepilin-type N-terminal cleavage/methylation domain-containing protein